MKQIYGHNRYIGDCMFGALKLIRNADPDKY